MKIHVWVILMLCMGVSKLASQPLKGTRWILAEVYKNKATENSLKDTTLRAMLFFNSDTAYTGIYCNRYFGKCAISADGKLSMHYPTASRRYCQGGYSEQEAYLFSWYSSMASYQLRQNRLILYTSNNDKLIFRKE